MGKQSASVAVHVSPASALLRPSLHPLRAEGNLWHHAVCVLWSFFVGASVTIRLRCSMKLSSFGTNPVVNAYCVACLVDVFAAICHLPFVSREALPRHSGPWLSAVCLIPAATLIVASRILGQFLVQLMLKFSVLFGALAVDVLLEKRPPETRRLLGMLVVLTGVVLVGATRETSLENIALSTYVLGLAAALATGIGYVLSARFCMPQGGADAISTAFVAFLASASIEMPALVISLSEGTGFCLRLQDIPLWIFATLQGAFYTRSFQVLPKQIGYAATFTLSLAAQLITAAFFDDSRSILSQASGLSLVLFGAALSEFSVT